MDRQTQAVQTTSASPSRLSGGARSRPNGDGWGWWRLPLKTTAFVLTLFLLGVIALGIDTKGGSEGLGRPESNGQHGTASLGVSPVSLNFGTVEIGAETKPQEITLNSTGSKAVKLGEIAVRGSHPADFESDHECSGKTLRTDRKCAVSVTFSPSGDGSRSARLMIHSATGDTKTVSLRGTGTVGGTARASLSPPVMEVGASVGETATRRFIFKNTGSRALTIYSVTVSDEYGFFTNTDDTCGNNSLEPGASCSIEVTFTPTSDHNSEGELAVKHDSPGSPSTARLEGAAKLPQTGGTILPPSSTASPSPSSTASSVPYNGGDQKATGYPRLPT